METETNEFKKELIDFFGLINPNIIGSSIQDLKLSCDIDIVEKNNSNKDTIFEYIKKIIKNQDKFIFITSRFNMKYGKIEKIYEKMEYLDGFLEIPKLNLNDIQKDIDNLPNILRLKIQKVFDNFVKNSSLENYLIVKEKLLKYYNPPWDLIDLEKGELQYYDEKFFIRDFNFDYFYIEILYKGLNVSYFFEYNVMPEEKKYFFCNFRAVNIFDQIKYYKFLKKLSYFFSYLMKNKYIKGEKIKIAKKYIQEISAFLSKNKNEYVENCKIYDLYKICDTRIKFKNKHQDNIFINDGNILIEISKDFEFWNDKTQKTFSEILDEFNSRNMSLDINEKIIEIYIQEKKNTKMRYLKNLRRLNFLSRILYEEIQNDFGYYLKKYFRMY